MLVASGREIAPVPYGQMPAIARNKVDLPQPEGPLTRMRAPASMTLVIGCSSGVPVGNVSASWSTVMCRDPFCVSVILLVDDGAVSRAA